MDGDNLPCAQIATVSEVYDQFITKKIKLTMLSAAFGDATLASLQKHMLCCA